jgi:site-specific recombinase XerD
MEDYIEHRLPKRAMSTQKEYERVIRARLIPTFGHMRPDDVTQQDIAAYLEFRETEEGNGPGANREMAVLSSVFNHGMRIRQCKFNPTYGVRRNEEKGRERYVTDQELRIALRTAGPALRYLLWATYLTGFRQGDLRRLTKDKLMPEGIRVREGKGGKHEMRLWSESLRKVVRRSAARTKCSHVFANSYGRAWTKDAIGNAMSRLKDKTGADWTFHDLRAKAETDHATGLGLMRRYTRVRKLAAVK